MAEITGNAEAMDAAALGIAREHDVIAPRVTIEAFCVTPAFASAMQTAAKDRRMAKTKTIVGMGGVGAAVKRYTNIGTPNLVVVETTEPSFGVFKDLERLSEVCGEDTRVIVAGPSNDVTLYRELIRQGVSEYLVSPPSPMQVIEAVVSVFATPEATPAARTLAVFGVRGGAGSSVIAHNLAQLIARRSAQDTILIDLDIEFGTAALDFNIETKSSIVDALAAQDDIDDIKLSRLLHARAEHLRVLAAPAELKARLRLEESAMLALLDVARFACDHLVLDAPHQWSPAVATALRQSGQVVLVATPDLASLRNLKAVYDWLVAERKHDAPPKIVLNQVGVPKRPEIAAKEFVDIVGAEIALTLPFDAAVFGQAQNDGKPLSEIAGAKKFVEQLEGLVDDLLGRATDGKRAPGAKAAAGFGLGALLGALGKGPGKGLSAKMGAAKASAPARG